LVLFLTAFSATPNYSIEAIPTFDPADAAANVEALDRMLSLAGAPERVVPGHDPLIFKRFPTKGRIAKIK